MKIKKYIISLIILIITSPLANADTITIEMLNKSGKELMVYSKKIINLKRILILKFY